MFKSAVRRCILAAGLGMVGLVTALSADAGTYKLLHSACSEADCTDGGVPGGGLIADAAGNLYGTNEAGGAYRWGNVFKITPGGAETVLYSFCPEANCPDGESPSSSLAMDSAGNLYGTTNMGGIQTVCDEPSCGVVFKVAPDGTETTLHTFCSQSNCSDGALPASGVLVDGQGNVYGTTTGGGIDGCNDTRGCGTVFKIAPNGTETVLYNFCSQTNCTDGAKPASNLIMDANGDLYGTTFDGGNIGECQNKYYSSGCGVIFELAPNGTETVLYTFCAQANCSDGANPMAGVTMDAAGNLYGTTIQGNVVGCDSYGGCGGVYKLTPGGVESVVLVFDGSNGGNSESNVVMDSSGNLYGVSAFTTAPFGQCFNEGCGNVFKLAPDGTETVLYTFCQKNKCKDGEKPYDVGSLALISTHKGKDLEIFGTVWAGGKTAGKTIGDGGIFRIKD
ncbi:MAG TPA: choice-of-anchor tandem repeat GloVer-containing protein [Rhizomicrobium sp.]|jgi:uncharacterized repeat protein (TIGR03803 family)